MAAGESDASPARVTHLHKMAEHYGSKPSKRIKRGAHGRSWREIAAEAKDHRAESLAQLPTMLPALPNPLPINVMDLPSKVLTQREIWITELQIDDILERLSGRSQSGDNLSSVEVTTAFLTRSALAQRLVRTEISYQAHMFRRNSEKEPPNMKLAEQTRRPTASLSFCPRSL